MMFAVILLVHLCTLPSLYPVLVLGQEPPECTLYKEALRQCDCVRHPDRGTAVIDCSNRSLTRLPQVQVAIPNVIDELRLNNNNITELQNNTFQGLQIRKIDLRGNSLSVVSDTSFQGLSSSLTILYIDGNGTSLPPKTALSTLTFMEELVMRNYLVPDLGHHVLGHQVLYFLPFTELKYLTLDNWGIQSIEPEAFTGPTNLLSLTLSKQSLSGIPINVLAVQGTNLKSLTKLTISNTHSLNHVSHLAFLKLDRIAELDLSHNSISQLENDCFLGITDTLTKLNLAGNVLTGISSDITGLKNMSKLAELDLSAQEQMTVFPDLSQLKTTVPLKLFLNNNKITELRLSSLGMVASQLNTLDISDNPIHNIDPSAFSSTPFLAALKMSKVAGSFQSSTLSSIIGPLKKLAALNISYNSLTEIANFTFENLTLLQDLDLSSNQLTNLSPESLVGPRGLTKLSLHNNNILTLSSCLFYGYTSTTPITMTLSSLSTLKCDCDIKWMWDRIKNGSLIFPPGYEPKCPDGQVLSNKTSADVCPMSPSMPQCPNYYIPTKLTFTKFVVTQTNISLVWTLTNAVNLKSYHLTADTNGHQVYNNLLTPSVNSLVVPSLKPDTAYTICITALFNTGKSVILCNTTKTLRDVAPSSPPSGKSEEVGIIVGAVIGGLVLIAILIAILYLVFIRKKPPKSANIPVQPRNFSKSELPTMTTEIRTFAKPKRTSAEQNHRDGMQVVAISDGQTGGPRVGRAHILTSDGSSKPRSRASSSSEQSTYENDRGILPKVPANKTGGPVGYYNMAFKKDSYDEIDPKRELSM